MATTDWTPVPADDLRAAQKRLNLSDEQIAVRLHVTAKTWWRWRTEGRVPTTAIPAVARVLELDLYERFDSPVPLTRNGTGENETVEAMRSLERRVEALDAKLDLLLAERATGH